MNAYLPLCKEGVNLLRQSIVILIGFVVLSLLTNIPGSFFKGFAWFYSIYSFASVLIFVGYSVTVPFFLLQRQQNKPLTPNVYITKTLRSTKRLLLPLLLFSLLLFIGLIIFVIIFVLVIHASSQDISTFLSKNPNNDSTTILFVLGILVLLFWARFASIYFTIENWSLFRSMQKGVAFSLTHVKFTLFTLAIEALFAIAAVYIRQIPTAGILITTIIGCTVNIYLSGLCLLYFQKIKSGYRI